MKYDEIRANLASKRDEIVSMLTRLASVASVRGEAAPGAPYGIECRRALEVTAQIFREYRIESRISDDGYLIAEPSFASSEKSAKTIGIFAHSDVVPAGEGWSLTEPFEPKEVNGCLVGRGVNDNKAGIAEALFSLLTLKELGCRFNSRIRIFVGSNEESGMGDIAAFVRNEPMPDVSLVPDAGFPVYRGEKGICRFYAVARRPFELIRGFDGGEAFNIVLGKASVRLPDQPGIYDALAAVCDKSERLSLESKDGELILRAEGISKHAALPDGSLNAARLAAQALLDSGVLPENDREIIDSALSMLTDSDKLFGISATDPDFGRTTVANGIVSIRDHKLVLAFDIRFVQSDGEKMLESVREKLDSLGFELEPTRMSPGFKIPEDDPTLLKLLDVYSECTGAQSPKAALNAGGTYSRCLKNAFSVGTTLGNPAPCALPGGHGGVHQPDEYTNIDALISAISVVAKMLLALDEVGE